MKKIKTKLISSLFLMLATISILQCFLIVGYLKHETISCYASIPIFFFIVGVISISLITKNNGKNGGKRANKYMLVRSVKILLGILFFASYWYVVKPDDGKGFAMTFAIFYLAYLVFEVWSILQIEKKNKNDVQKTS